MRADVTQPHTLLNNETKKRTTIEHFEQCIPDAFDACLELGDHFAVVEHGGEGVLVDLVDFDLVLEEMFNGGQEVFALLA